MKITVDAVLGKRWKQLKSDRSFASDSSFLSHLLDHAETCLLPTIRIEHGEEFDSLVDVSATQKSAIRTPSEMDRSEPEVTVVQLVAEKSSELDQQPSSETDGTQIGSGGGRPRRTIKPTRKFAEYETSPKFNKSMKLFSKVDASENEENTSEILVPLQGSPNVKMVIFRSSDSGTPVKEVRIGTIADLDKELKVPKPLFECDLCPAKYRTQKQFDKHSTTHTQKDLVKCDECDEYFTKRTIYNHKRNVHNKVTDESDLTCQFCKKSFLKIDNLRWHIKFTHEQLRRHKCEECGASFHSKMGLIEHYRVHTGEKPLICTLCGEAFRQSGSFSKHMIKIHNLRKREYKGLKRPVPDQGLEEQDSVVEEDSLTTTVTIDA